MSFDISIQDILYYQISFIYIIIFKKKKKEKHFFLLFVKAHFCPLFKNTFLFPVQFHPNPLNVPLLYSCITCTTNADSTHNHYHLIMMNKNIVSQSLPKMTSYFGQAKRTAYLQHSYKKHHRDKKVGSC